MRKKHNVLHMYINFCAAFSWESVQKASFNDKDANDCFRHGACFESSKGNTRSYDRVIWVKTFSLLAHQCSRKKTCFRAHRLQLCMYIKCVLRLIKCCCRCWWKREVLVRTSVVQHAQRCCKTSGKLSITPLQPFAGIWEMIRSFKFPFLFHWD